MRRYFLLSAALATFLSACSLPTAPGYGDRWYVQPVPGYVLQPSEEFEEWFEELVECAGPARRPYESISWRVVEVIWFRATPDQEWERVYGFYADNTIYLLHSYVIAWEYAVIRYVARHEMLHHIRQEGHPQVDPWLDRCI